MDPIANMLIILKNASLVKKPRAYLPFSKINLGILKILESKGYISNIKKIGRTPKFKLRCDLIYIDSQPKFEIIKRISKPSRRVYIKYREIKLNPPGFHIISTSKGLMDDSKAKKMKLGGEVICFIR